MPKEKFYLQVKDNVLVELRGMDDVTVEKYPMTKKGFKKAYEKCFRLNNNHDDVTYSLAFHLKKLGKPVPSNFFPVAGTIQPTIKGTNNA